MEQLFGARVQIKIQTVKGAGVKLRFSKSNYVFVRVLINIVAAKLAILDNDPSV